MQKALTYIFNDRMVFLSLPLWFCDMTLLDDIELIRSSLMGVSILMTCRFIYKLTRVFVTNKLFESQIQGDDLHKEYK